MHLDKPPVTAYALKGAADKLENVMIIGNNLHVDAFYDKATSTISYLVMDRETRQCALIDSVLDYDPKSGRTCSASADRLIERVTELNANVRWVLETHVHADHLSAAAYLKEKLGGHTAIGAHIAQVQKVFGALFNAEPGFARDGSQFDVLFEDEEGFRIGNLHARALHTPGHTPACMSYMIEDAGEIAVFVGDTLFMPDYGTARCDFPGADARTLYRSIRRLLAFPDQTRLFMCHDYLPGGRDMQYVTTVAEQRAGNIHIRQGIDEDSFVAMREARDKTLDMPVLILPSVQVNMRSGQLPPPEANGVSYLKIPLNKL